MNEYMALTSNADDLPSFYVNTTQPLHSLLSSARYRIGAVTQVLENLAMRGEISTDSVILSDFALSRCGLAGNTDVTVRPSSRAGSLPQGLR